jgi:hypothetical protein
MLGRDAVFRSVLLGNEKFLNDGHRLLLMLLLGRAMNDDEANSKYVFVGRVDAIINSVRMVVVVVV